MSQEFDEVQRRSGERRSRKNPKLRETDQKTPVDSRDSREAYQQSSAAYAQAPTGRTASGLTVKAETQIKQARRRRRIIAMVAAECLALMFIFGYAYVAKRLNMIQRPYFEIAAVKNEELSFETVEKMKGYWTIAVFGVDTRGKALEKSTNADVNMICSINMDTGEVRLVSVFRDSYLNISENGSYNKLNQAYFLGGPQQAVAALNRNLDLDIENYVTFNWKAVADAINILGGVDIELTKAEYYYINSFITETVKATGVPSTHLTHAGMNHLDGIQAVAYGRLRLMDTDFARTERQRKVIALAFEKAKAADIGVLNNIVEVLFEQVATNIEVKDMIHMALNINKYHLGETVGFPMARGDANMGKKGAVVVPQTLETNVVQLHNFLFDDDAYTTTTAVRNISAQIASDTGMYQEGKYVNRVSTEGGVIQSTKAAAGETKKSSDDEETGKSSTQESERETDANGNYITKPTNTTEETNEDGNVIETSSGAVRPTESDSQSESTRPSSTASAPESRPGETAESTASTPGSTTETTAARPGSTTETTAARPGSTTESTAARPGSTTESTAASPGSSTESAGSNGSSGPGSASESTASPSPGSTNSTVAAPGSTISSSGPGSTTAPTSSAPDSPGSLNPEIPTVSGPGL